VLDGDHDFHDVAQRPAHSFDETGLLIRSLRKHLQVLHHGAALEDFADHCHGKAKGQQRQEIRGKGRQICKIGANVLPQAR
jgi:hypothetical protein